MSDEPFVLVTPAEIEVLAKPSPGKRQSLHEILGEGFNNDDGHPLANGRIEILYSAGNVVENQKAQTGDDGFAALSSIPGSIYVTLQTAGCKKEDRRADVAPGPGVDGFKFSYDCAGD